ncbi:uncharacterized protein RHIMIDRAFT_271277, partial [Rhizopus microsporus ATCC 52813]
VQELSYKKHNEQKESIKLWLKNLQQQRGYFIYIAQNLEQSYTFGFPMLYYITLLLDIPLQEVVAQLPFSLLMVIQ